MKPKTKKGSLRRTPENKARRLGDDISRCTAALERTKDELSLLSHDDTEKRTYLEAKKGGIERHIKWLEERVVFWKNGGKDRAQR